eukprot:3575138-Amphidinium_carterae.1
MSIVCYFCGRPGHTTNAGGKILPTISTNQLLSGHSKPSITTTDASTIICIYNPGTTNCEPIGSKLRMKLDPTHKCT